jgi:hypothetical protein
MVPQGLGGHGDFGKLVGLAHDAPIADRADDKGGDGHQAAETEEFLADRHGLEHFRNPFLALGDGAQGALPRIDRWFNISSCLKSGKLIN